MSSDDPYEWTPESMVEITLNEPDDFLKVKETVTRMGVSSRHEKVLYQSCNILHKQGRYFIVHFKELFRLDGKPANLTVGDIQRRNTIITLLSDWGLLEIVDPSTVTDVAPVRKIKIITHSEKKDWELKAKYTIGNNNK